MFIVILIFSILISTISRLFLSNFSTSDRPYQEQILSSQYNAQVVNSVCLIVAITTAEEAGEMTGKQEYSCDNVYSSFQLCFCFFFFYNK